MKALGASRWDIFKIIWIETSLICTAGGIVGITLSLFGGNLIENIIKMILPYAPSGNLIFIPSSLAFYSFIGAILLGLISGIYPAFRASSVHPIDAIRRGE